MHRSQTTTQNDGRNTEEEIRQSFDYVPDQLKPVTMLFQRPTEQPLTVDQYVTNNNTLEVPEEVSPRATSRLDVRKSVKAEDCKDAIAEMKEKRWKTTASYVPPASQLNDCFKRVNQKVELKKTMSGNHVKIQRENVQQSLKAAIAYITIEETKVETSSRFNSIAMSPGNPASVGSP